MDANKLQALDEEFAGWDFRRRLKIANQLASVLRAWGFDPLRMRLAPEFFRAQAQGEVNGTR
jgi:hypothetical protein